MKNMNNGLFIYYYYFLLNYWLTKKVMQGIMLVSKQFCDICKCISWAGWQIQNLKINLKSETVTSVPSPPCPRRFGSSEFWTRFSFSPCLCVLCLGLFPTLNISWSLAPVSSLCFSYFSQLVPHSCIRSPSCSVAFWKLRLCLSLSLLPVQCSSATKILIFAQSISLFQFLYQAQTQEASMHIYFQLFPLFLDSEINIFLLWIPPCVSLSPWHYDRNRPKGQAISKYQYKDAKSRKTDNVKTIKKNNL